MEWVLVTPESAPRMEPVLPDLRVLEPELGSLFRWRAGEAEAVLERCAGGWNRSEERPGRDLQTGDLSGVLITRDLPTRLESKLCTIIIIHFNICLVQTKLHSEQVHTDLARCPGCELADQVPLLVELALFLLTYASAAWR